MEYPTVGTLESIGRNIETSDRKYLSSRLQRESPITVYAHIEYFITTGG